jgi:sugar/nucleoside kinase (ribokinase family)
MPRLLAIGHVTWDRLPDGEVLGGTVSYAALAARKLGWEAGVLTSAAPDFDPERELPGVAAFVRRAPATTRYQNLYDEEGGRRQVLSARAEDIDLAVLPDDWRDPEVLLLGPVAGEMAGGMAPAFEAGVVGATAQGWLRAFDKSGAVSTREWTSAAADLAGVHALFLSEGDAARASILARELLRAVPIVALTRGWRGSTLLTREGDHEVPTLPRHEADPTGAGDVFAAAFLVRYHETQDPMESCVFAACAASCVVERIGSAGLGDRAEVLRRMTLLERLVEEGEWEE